MHLDRLGIVVCIAIASACQRKAETPPPPAVAQSPAAVEVPQGATAGDWQATPLGRDLDRICNVIDRSGSGHLPEGDQIMAVASWLPNNIESEAGREFLASIANLDGDAKAEALVAGARRVGLAGCPTAELWRGR